MVVKLLSTTPLILPTQILSDATAMRCRRAGLRRLPSRAHLGRIAPWFGCRSSPVQRSKASSPQKEPRLVRIDTGFLSIDDTQRKYPTIRLQPLPNRGLCEGKPRLQSIYMKFAATSKSCATAPVKSTRELCTSVVGRSRHASAQCSPAHRRAIILHPHLCVRHCPSLSSKDETRSF
jgi:hypothetical protein